MDGTQPLLAPRARDQCGWARYKARDGCISMLKKRRRFRVWVVMHYEIMTGQYVDCLQFHVSSSRHAAEVYIGQSHVAPYSWWQVHPHVLDHDPVIGGWEGEEVYYYSHTGRPLQAAPIQRAINAYKRAQGKE